MSDLPPCRHRGLVREDGLYPCGSCHLLVFGPGVSAADCQRCHVPDKECPEGGLPKPPAPLGPCRHLGEATGELVACSSCTGNVRVKTMRCGLHGVCLPHKQVEGIVCCATCRDRTPV